jgi:hypothetical protein
MGCGRRAESVGGSAPRSQRPAPVTATSSNRSRERRCSSAPDGADCLYIETYIETDRTPATPAAPAAPLVPLLSPNFLTRSPCVRASAHSARPVNCVPCRASSCTERYLLTALPSLGSLPSPRRWHSTYIEEVSTDKQAEVKPEADRLPNKLLDDFKPASLSLHGYIDLRPVTRTTGSACTCAFAHVRPMREARKVLSSLVCSLARSSICEHEHQSPQARSSPPPAHALRGDASEFQPRAAAAARARVTGTYSMVQQSAQTVY